MSGTSGVLEQDDDDMMLTYHKKKRLKTSEISDMPASINSEISTEETGTSSHGTYVDQSVQIDKPNGVASENSDAHKLTSMSPEKNSNGPERDVSAEIDTDDVLIVNRRSCDEDISDNKPSEGLQDEAKVFAEQNNDVDMLMSESLEKKSDGAENDVILINGVPAETHMDDVFITKRRSCDEDISENKPFEEMLDESRVVSEQTSDLDSVICMLPEKKPDGTGNEVILNLVSADTHIDGALITNRRSCDEDISESKSLEEVNSGKLPRLFSADADPSSSQLDGLKEVTSHQVVNESVNVEDRTFYACTKKKLIVLDVNGLLIDTCSYVPYDYDWDDIILKKAVFKRPYCDDFLKFCFERFNVGFWTSKTKRNIEPVLDFLLWKDKRKLLFTWDQSHCTQTGFYTVEKRHKPLLLKKLKKLWDKCEPELPWERGEFNESNTLLIDDSPYKALCNPRYSAIFPYPYRFRDLKDDALGPSGDLRVYLEGLAMAENVQEYVKQNPYGQRCITEKNLSWGFYLKVIEASSSPPRQADNEAGICQVDNEAGICQANANNEADICQANANNEADICLANANNEADICQANANNEADICHTVTEEN